MHMSNIITYQVLYFIVVYSAEIVLAFLGKRRFGPGNASGVQRSAEMYFRKKKLKK